MALVHFPSKRPKWGFASFYLHLFFDMKKAQKPSRLLGFLGKHLFGCLIMVAKEGLEPTPFAFAVP